MAKLHCGGENVEKTSRPQVGNIQYGAKPDIFKYARHPHQDCHQSNIRYSQSSHGDGEVRRLCLEKGGGTRNLARSQMDANSCHVR